MQSEETQPGKLLFIEWYETHGRDFPWRREGTSPFAILVTEMLLRQTYAIPVAKLWNEFIQKYPDAETLAKAGEKELVNQLKVLGLARQRSSALSSAARWIVIQYKGKLPNTRDELLEIPHVGVYVANAILCFAFNQRVEIVDTNILRFYARYYGLSTKPDIRRNPEIWRIARESLPNEKWKQHNYGLLDFTADVCKAKTPLCTSCPLTTTCKYSSLAIERNSS